MEPIKAIICRSDRRIFECLDLDSKKTYKAIAPAKMLAKKFNQNLVVGDYVLLAQEKDEYVIVEKQERKNELNRTIPREKTLKTIAANIDYLMIICAVSSPPYRSNLIDRFLARAYYHQIEPMVIFNKLDQLPPDFDLEYERDKFDFLGVKNFAISSIKEENDPINQEMPILKNLLSQKTAVFWGQSGVGKSKLINLLSQGTFSLKSKSIGKVGKGVHTTTWAQLINLGDSYLIDTPGIRSFSLDDIAYNALIELFPDLDRLQANCKFHDCSHEPNSKGCYFHSLEFQQDTNFRYMNSRFENYKKIEADLISSQKKY